MKGTCTAAGRVAPTPCSVSLYMFILCFCFVFKPLSNRKSRITRSSVSGNSTSSAGVSYIVGGGRQLLVGGNMCLRRQCYLRRQYYPHLSRALCWESVPPPILNLSPTTSSSDTLPPGSPLDRLRGIQRRASGHKSAARRFLHKLRRAHRHLIVELLSMSPGGK